MPVMPSGICLTALFGSIVLEHRRLQSEASKIRGALKALGAAKGAPRPLDLQGLSLAECKSA